MARLVWLPAAKRDIARLHSFLKDKSPKAARNAVRTIRGAARQIQQYAEAGRPMADGTGRRELFVAFGSGGYVLRYILDGQDAVIVRVWHSRERR